MTAPAVSVIVVSRGRPEALNRCLSGLAQLAYDPFEVVVVADPAGIAAIAAWQPALKWAVFDEPNISAARNIGAGLAAGDILAFIDDDAVAEPSWLDHLIAPFADPSVGIAGGYVLGRDGINFQYRANRLDRLANPVALPVAGDAPVVLDAPQEGAIKTEGTNFAIRRQLLADHGGFDAAFRYYLDETDLNMRLARAGARTAIVPLALVHHGFAASQRRSAEARALDLFDIGASLQVFLRKHVPPADHDARVAAMRRHQRRLLDMHARKGRCTPAEAAAVLQTFEEGLVAGRDRACGRPASLAAPTAPMKRFAGPVRFSGSVWLAGRAWQRRRRRREAAERVARGERVTLILLSPTTRFLRVRFDAGGFWEHRGGQFGRARAEEPLFRWATLRSRARREVARVRVPRMLGK